MRIDDDLVFDLLPAIERSFDVHLHDDALRRIVTVGDLHRLILASAPYAGGDRCGTSHVFYALRSALAPFGITPSARPGTGLGATSASPKAVARAIRAALGLELPGHHLGLAGSVGCGLLAIVSVPVTWFVGWWTVFPLALLAGAVVRLDRGAWSGEWATMGSLARSMAALNHAALHRRGAIHSHATAWRALVAMIAPYYADDPSGIVPGSRLST